MAKVKRIPQGNEMTEVWYQQNKTLALQVISGGPLEHVLRTEGDGIDIGYIFKDLIDAACARATSVGTFESFSYYANTQVLGEANVRLDGSGLDFQNEFFADLKSNATMWPNVTINSWMTPMYVESNPLLERNGVVRFDQMPAYLDNIVEEWVKEVEG